MKRIMLAGIAVLLLLTGCESLRRIGLSIERPTATVVGVSVSRLDFREAELTAEILVENPNAVGITLTGFSYTLVVEGVEFLSGTQTRGVSIPAFGERSFEFPVTVGFRNLVDTVGAMRDRDEASYTFEIDLGFELPILGEVTVPVRREGTFPIVRLPT
ncbi:MAG TPA: LEA type 2 family protein, partial [Spirochaetia bacterium]|nr:LEA type 2 family protein [Spirochaetia bacterium]